MTRSQYLTRSQDFEDPMPDNLLPSSADMLREELHPEDSPCGTEPTGRRERRRQETRERLFEAAVRLLSEREFEAVTVEAITEAADVGKGTFFNYFANKEAVVGYFFVYKSSRLAEAARQVNSVDALPDSCTDDLPGGPIWRKMLRVFSLSSDSPKEDRRLSRTLLSLVLTNIEVRRAYEVMMQEIGNLTRGFIEEAQRSGEVRTDLTAEQIVSHLHMVHLGAVSYWAYSERAESMEEMLRRAYHLLWEGVASREKSEPIIAEPQPAST